jgi:hypothetical protein
MVRMSVILDLICVSMVDPGNRSCGLAPRLSLLLIKNMDTPPVNSVSYSRVYRKSSNDSLDARSKARNYGRMSV